MTTATRSPAVAEAAEAGFDALKAGEVEAKQQGKLSEPGSAEA